VTSVRFGAAAALLLSVAAVGLAVAALMATLRDDRGDRGRLINTRVSVEVAADAVLFPLDDLYIVRDVTGDVHALYLYPPGFFGHVRGCRVVWDGVTPATTDPAAPPGIFIDPCSGARFARDGTLLAGPADRGLDYFELLPGVDGVVVDTRRLYCGDPPTALQPTATPASKSTPCARVHPDD
jgi:hypothetical protein